MEFKGKVVVVTGGSSGIGAAAARRFAEEGASLAIAYRANRSGAEEVAQGIEELGGSVLTQQAELSREQDAVKLIEAATAKFGRLDVLVNSAGGYIDGDEWNGVSEVWLKLSSRTWYQ